tara:strand:- start:140 stop:769 length:630 start_codon:yes stop_codon:yes gene_type:complete
MNTLILLRHGQSQWNLENRFTGWEDVPLTDKGITEAKLAGQLMRNNNIKLDLVFSSKLKRANQTAEIAIKEMNLDHLWKKNEIIMTRNINLNERDYGDLVGLNKEETANKYGKEQVHIWRRSYDIPPPGGESLKDVVERVSPYFIKYIKPQISKNRNIIIVAHGNSLRALMIEIGLYKSDEISNIEIPTGSPLLISYENGKLIESSYLN